MTKENTNYRKVFTRLLTIVFIVLKMTNTINWSWWWVLSPAWIPLVIGLVFLIVALRSADDYDKQ